MNHDGYLSAALSGERGEGADHTASCETCRRELEALRDLEFALRASAPPAPKDEIWEARLVARARTLAGTSGGHPRASIRWSSLAASFLLAATLAASLRLLPAREASPALAAESPATAVGTLGWDLSSENATLALLREAEAVAGESAEEEDLIGDAFESPVFGGENG
jgi:anti-sigma factor RsiW